MKSLSVQEIKPALEDCRVWRNGFILLCLIELYLWKLEAKNKELQKWGHYSKTEFSREIAVIILGISIICL
jgi:hypothetical protein